MDDNSSNRMWEHVRRHEYYAFRVRSMIGMTSIIFVFMFGFIAVFFSPPLKSILQHKDELLSAQLHGLTAIPDLQAKIALLNDQVKLLTTTSIETRLQTIETAIHSGNLKPEQIASFEDMRKELETLKTYMFQDPQKLVDLKQLQKDYRELSFATSGYATKQELESKNAFTRDILYVSLALWGILFTVVGLPIIWRGRRTIPTEPVTSDLAKTTAEDLEHTPTPPA
jgi:hypothetical protein